MRSAECGIVQHGPDQGGAAKGEGVEGDVEEPVVTLRDDNGLRRPLLDGVAGVDTLTPALSLPGRGNQLSLLGGALGLRQQQVAIRKALP